MKILLIHNDYQLAGGERNAINAQIKLLNKNGHELIHYMRENEEIERYGLLKKAAFFPNTLYSFRTVKEITRIVKAEKPDLAHIHNVFPLISPSVYRTLHKLSVPMVQTVHNFRFLCPNAYFFIKGNICELCKMGNTIHAIPRKCFHESYSLSALYALSIGLHRRFGTFDLIDRFIALTDFTRQKLIESHLTRPEKICILGNFFPEPLPYPGSMEKRLPYVVYLGRLSPEKGLMTLIEAMRFLPDLQLKILGSGPEESIIRKMIEDKKLRNIQLVGFVSGDEKWNILREASAVVIPSLWYENFPIVVLESLVVGTTIIAANLGSIPYILEDGKNSLLFKPGDIQDLVNKLKCLSNSNEIIQIRKNSQSTFNEKFNEIITYSNLIAVYQDLVAKASQA